MHSIDEFMSSRNEDGQQPARTAPAGKNDDTDLDSVPF